MKRCCACGETKPLDDFSRRTASKDGLQHRCRPCANERQSAWRAANPEKARAYARANYRKHAEHARRYAKGAYPGRRLARYGLTAEAYDEMLIAQGNRCAICRTDKPGGRGSWHIDHDHSCCGGRGSCGECVRGILCYACNSSLGYIKDDPSIALRMASYLTRSVNSED
jgi:hypothetical protein